MNRRHLATGLLMTVASLGMRNAGAQTPVSSPPVDEKSVPDYSNIGERTDLIRAMYSYSYLPSAGIADLLDGSLLALDAYGFEFASESDVGVAVEDLQRAYTRWARETRVYTIEDVKRASARALGDETWAFVGATNNDENDATWGLYTVRQGTFAQVLIGWMGVGNVVSSLADIAERTLDRWPNDRSFAAILPQLNDLEEGMVIDREFDITAAFASD